MTKFTKNTIGALALLFVVIAAGAIGVAQQEGGGGGRDGYRRHRAGKHSGGMHGGGMRGFGNLDLTATQQEQMRQISERYRQNAKQQADDRDDENRFDLFDGTTFNEAAVRAAAEKRAARHVEMEVAHARMYSEMYAVLTTEQKAKLAEQRRERELRRQQWRERRNSRNNGGDAPSTNQL